MATTNRISRGVMPLLLVSSLALAFGPAGAATITIVNNNGPGVGFNDPTVVAPVGGNPGVTLGQQRLNVFQHAADIWGSILPSSVPILVRAQFAAQTCTKRNDPGAASQPPHPAVKGFDVAQRIKD